MGDFSISPLWLRGAGLRAVFGALNAVGEARVVGGAVRNTLLGAPLGDVDLATTLTPDAVERAASEAGLKVHETGLTHGTLTLVAAGQAFEVTTLREDVSTDGRRATVRFTEAWGRDAARRDFTMNALYVSADGTGSDYVGGYRDCMDGRVRFIGDPRRRILEDNLRILRFFRFYAHYGQGPMDADALAASLNNKALVASLPAERVQGELIKLFRAEGAAPVVKLLAEHEVLAPFITTPLNVVTYRALFDAEKTAGRSPSAVLGFLALVDFNPDSFTALAKTLKLSRRMRTRGLAAVAAAQTMPPRSERDVRTLLFDHGTEAFTDGLMIAIARGADVINRAALLRQARSWSAPIFPVGGHDLLAQGGEAGPALGARLTRLEGLWRESDFSMSRDKLLKLDRDALKTTG